MLFLIPVIIYSCDFTDFCLVPKPQQNMVKYYEPNKSCYVNGTFYTKCEDANAN